MERERDFYAERVQSLLVERGKCESKCAKLEEVEAERELEVQWLKQQLALRAQRSLELETQLAEVISEAESSSAYVLWGTNDEVEKPLPRSQLPAPFAASPSEEPLSSVAVDGSLKLHSVDNDLAEGLVIMEGVEGGEEWDALNAERTVLGDLLREAMDAGLRADRLARFMMGKNEELQQTLTTQVLSSSNGSDSKGRLLHIILLRRRKELLLKGFSAIRHCSIEAKAAELEVCKRKLRTTSKWLACALVSVTAKLLSFHIFMPYFLYV